MTQQASPILVTGATGNTGRAVVDALARRGALVRAMVRAEADRASVVVAVGGLVIYLLLPKLTQVLASWPRLAGLDLGEARRDRRHQHLRIIAEKSGQCRSAAIGRQVAQLQGARRFHKQSGRDMQRTVEA